MQASSQPVSDNYSILGPLGEGGFGIVWAAEDRLIPDRLVAIKEIRRDRIADESLLIEEMQHLSAIDHPNVVKFLHHCRDDKTLYLVMEYCEGGSLADVLENCILKTDEVFAWARALTATLGEIHRRGIVHHDIKPQNLLLSADRRVKVSDFGVANSKGGTRAYMAPECVLGEVECDDVRIDIYALGITLLELLTGNNPLRRIPAKNLLRRQIAHDFIPSDPPRWIQDILRKATHPTPELRFQTMEAFGEAIATHYVPFLIDGDRIKAHQYADKATRLLNRKQWEKASYYAGEALSISKECVAAQIVAGRVALSLKRISLAKEYFSEAARINARVALQKELGWIALEEGQYPQAISMLTDHLQRESSDFEACNLLMQCFYETERYELAESVSDTVIAQRVPNDCFENNRLLSQALACDDPAEFITRHKSLKLDNPFIRFNRDVAAETPSSWCDKAGRSLKSKLLFEDYRFGTRERRTPKHKLCLLGNFEEETGLMANRASEEQALYFDCGDGYRYSFHTPLITLGRLASNHLPFDQGGVSRRHAVIVNAPGDVWIYDLGSVLGVAVDGQRISRKAFLCGVHQVDLGARTIRMKTDENLMI